MTRPIHAGARSLDDAGLVAFMPCGHWWVYPVHASPEQLHELARLNLGLDCDFCLADWRAATRAQARPTATRVN
jgi:hypothetical protein